MATATISMSALLIEAVTVPGRINAAYRAFHNYSLGNQMAAAFQLDLRGIPLGPIASFMAWKDKGRSVKKGAKAIALCMPITCKGTKETPQGDEEYAFSRFIWKNNWFVLSETEGADYANEVVTPAWDATKALAALDITQTDFKHVNGNIQGYASGRTIAINPVAAFPHKTRFHELAHIVLGHTSEGQNMTDSEATPRDIMEVEAESTAYILCSLLDLPGQPESRSYVQNWLDGAEISERSAQKIYAAANKILKAGE